MSDVAVDVRDAPGGTTVLRLRGFVEKSAIRKLDQAIGQLIERGKNRLVVNCADLKYISSEGMGIFLSYLIKIRKTGGDIKFCSMRQETKTVFNVLRINNFLKTFETEDEAIRDFVGDDEEIVEEEEQQLVVSPIALTDRICVAHLRGFIDRHTLSLLEKALRKALKEGRVVIILNCKQLSYINSAGLGILIQYLKEARQRGGDICFCETQDSVNTLISMLGLHNLYRIFDTEEEAVNAYR